jgi:hypothetical protein
MPTHTILHRWIIRPDEAEGISDVVARFVPEPGHSTLERAGWSRTMYLFAPSFDLEVGQDHLRITRPALDSDYLGYFDSKNPAYKVIQELSAGHSGARLQVDAECLAGYYWSLYTRAATIELAVDNGPPLHFFELRVSFGESESISVRHARIRETINKLYDLLFGEEERPRAEDNRPYREIALAGHQAALNVAGKAAWAALMLSC